MSGFLLFYLHGLNKLKNPEPFVNFVSNVFSFLPFPEVFAWFAILAESIIALSFALGLFTRISAYILTVNFLAALYYHIQIASDSILDYEKALLYFVIFLSFSLIGPAGYSIDRNLLKRN